ncbi:flavin reductase (NADPH) [Anthonomus grandis grandis]|uniref:flavin reductase (NADPH) n=1 Tax=Anthonomus grandis grandis TaxID=2921223 RepID=UPI00216660D5|nr:flavin reductase (NADPH) [Anthonomus grandis grandis]
MEKIAIFGATGMTGVCTTEAALKKGLKVKALVRDLTKVPENLKDKIEIVQGNVLNYPDVLKTLEGVKAVIVNLGTRNDLKATTDLSEGLKNIVKAMKESNIEIVSVCLSAFLFHDPTSDKVPAIFRDLNADHQRMFDILKESGLKYVAVFPPHISDQPSSSYQVEHDKYLGRVVSKYDLAQFFVDSLSQPEHYGHVCGIISKPN